MTDEDFKRKLDAVMKDVVENVDRAFVAKRAIMYMLPLGEREIRPGYVGCFRARVTAPAFKINALGYSTNWTPDPLRWWWTIRIVAWILRVIFRRRRSYRPRSPFLVERFYGDDVPWDPRTNRPIASYAQGPLELLGWDIQRGPVNEVFRGPAALVVRNGVQIEVWVRNTHPTRTAKLWLGLSGEALVDG